MADTAARTLRGLRAAAGPLLSPRAPWAPAACAVYTANVLVGTASLRRHRLPRSLHHRLFVLTCATTSCAAACSLPRARPRGLALAGALLPLAALPRFGAHARRRPRRHVLLAASAAPFYLTALALWAAGLRDHQEA
jgi:hypothetical protein